VVHQDEWHERETDMSERTPSEAELIERIRSIDVRAPQSLHDSVHSLLAERAAKRRRWGGLPFLLSGPRIAAAGALAAAALALALAFGLSGGGSAPSLRQTAAVTLSAATSGAPHESTIDRAALTAAVDGVSFPYWEDHFGWRSTGKRSDRIAGRRITTIFYADRHGRQVGYAIVSGLPAPRQPAGATAWRARVPYRLLNINGVTVVSWLRSGHLCVLSGRGVDGATLLRLASGAPRRSLA
jgi:hypothetical protein